MLVETVICSRVLMNLGSSYSWETGYPLRFPSLFHILSYRKWTPGFIRDSEDNVSHYSVQFHMNNWCSYQFIIYKNNLRLWKVVAPNYLLYLVQSHVIPDIQLNNKNNNFKLSRVMYNSSVGCKPEVSCLWLYNNFSFSLVTGRYCSL